MSDAPRTTPDAQTAERCINFPCQLPHGHQGPCCSADPVKRDSVPAVPDEWRALYIDAKAGLLNQNADWQPTIVKLIAENANLRTQLQEPGSSTGQLRGRGASTPE